MYGKERVLSKFISTGFILLLAILSGCGQSGRTAGDVGALGQITGEPLNLTVYQTSASITDQEFQQFIADPVHRKYPNITMQIIHQTPDNTPARLVAGGSLSDIDVIFGSQASPRVFSDLGGALDLADSIKKNQVDLGKFDPVTISAIQTYGDGKMLALPFSVKFSLMYYNKDVFDKFAVPYPKDGLTWEETAEIARKLTQVSGGVQYEGFALDGNAGRIGGQLSLPLVDPRTNKATLATDGWKRIYEVMKMFQDIPGYSSKVGKNEFLKDQTVAMLVSQAARIGEIEDMYNQGQKLNWGIASLPSFKEAMGKGFAPTMDLLMISAASKHPAEAFAVLTLLTGEDVQREIGKWGKLSSLKDEKIKETFGQSLKSMQGVSTKPILTYVQSPEPPFSPYADEVGKPLNSAVTKALSGVTDINTALREAEDAANKAIAEAAVK